MNLRIFLACGIAIASVFEPPAAVSQEAILQEIVVTARRRAENLQDVPIAVSVLSGSFLQENLIRNADDLYGLVPGLYFTNSGGITPTSDYIYLILRGVGFNGGQEPATGMFVDGMYVPQLGYDIEFLDLERLEVLRGPQGTLFGRNTQAGALNLVTRKPGESFSGKAEIEAARFDTYRVLAAVSGPLADGVYGGLSGQYRQTDGYMNNTVAGAQDIDSSEYSVRGTLRWVQGDAFEANLAVDTSRWDGNEMDFGSLLSCRCYALEQDRRAEDSRKNDGAQLTADWSLAESLKFTSITGYRELEAATFAEFDGVETDQTPTTATGPPDASGSFVPATFQGDNQDLLTTQRYWSEELRLAGNAESVDWLVGAYYFEQDQRNYAQQELGPGVVTDPAIAFLVPLIDRLDFSSDREGWALFGQASWRPADRLELTGGIRYAEERVSVDGYFFRNIVAFENDNPNFFNAADRDTFDNVSPMGSISWRFGETTKVYATVSKGWKAGGFSRYPSEATAVVPYDAETSVNYELGLKSTSASGRFVVNAALFEIDIKDQQLFTTTFDSAGVPVSTITNAGESRSRGAELEVSARPHDSLDLSLALAYTDAEFVDFTQQAADGSFVVRDGQPFEFVPKWTGSASVEYRFAVTQRADVALNISYRYVDDYVVPNSAVLAPLGGTIPVDAYDRLDLRATVNLGSWAITGYLRNALDSFDYTNIFYGTFVAQTPASQLVTPLEPRTYGIVVSTTF